MTVISDDELEARIRASLDAWADHAPVTPDRSAELASVPAARTRPVMALAAAAVLVVVAILATVLRGPDETPTVAGPGAGPVRIPVGNQVGVRALAADGNAIWLMSAREHTLFRIDPRTQQVVGSFDAGGYFEGIAAGDGLVWLTGYEPTRIVALDAVTGDLVHEVPIDFDPWGVTVAFGGAWVGGGGQLTRVDVVSGAVTTFDLERSTGFLAAGDDALWVAEPEGSAVVEVDPDTGDVVSEVAVGGSPRGVEVAPDGAVWVTLPVEDAVVRIDPGSASVTARVALGPSPDSIAFVEREVWVTTRAEGTITRVDGDDAAVIAVHPVGNVPAGIVTAFERVWVSLHQEAAVVAIDPREPLPTTSPPSFVGWITISDHDVYLRCRGTGDATVVLRQDIWHDTGALPVLESLLAARTRVCITARPDDPADDAGDLAPDLRGALEGAGIPGPYVLVGHGYGGLMARELAATWDDVAGLVLLDANTRPTFAGPERDDPFLQSVAARFERVDGLAIVVPTAVVTSDPEADPDPRSGAASARKQWLAQQRELSGRLDATFTVIHDDPWVPTYRPATVADVIMELVERLA